VEVSSGTSETVMRGFFKKTINREYTCIFSLLLAVCIVFISAVNLLTLEKAYMYNKQKVLLSCYR
jgi:hypothetical protein